MPTELRSSSPANKKPHMPGVFLGSAAVGADRSLSPMTPVRSQGRSDENSLPFPLRPMAWRIPSTDSLQNPVDLHKGDEAG